MKLSPSRSTLAIAAMLVLGTAATACGSDDNTSAATTPVATAPAVTTPAATEAPVVTDAPVVTEAPVVSDAPTPTDAPAGTDAPAAGAAVVNLADTSLGKVLVDGQGMTLYMFKPDNQGPSVCTGGCLGAWPSLTGPATAGAGVDASLLATVARTDDGTQQVTYNGWPLYTFAQDKAPGDVTGQDSNEKWYVVDATGTPIED